MPIDLHRFCTLRPCLYHLTAEANVESILSSGRLWSAKSLMERTGNSAALRAKRAEHLRVQSNGTSALLRDQAPLYEGNIELEGGCTFADFVEMLNSRVFFWPGTRVKPIEHGIRHFGRYADEECAVLVVETRSLLDANPATLPEFCRFNSGSPRCRCIGGLGRGSPRGPATFLPGQSCEFRASDVKEVTFQASVLLPERGVRVASHRDWVGLSA